MDDIWLALAVQIALWAVLIMIALVLGDGTEATVVWLIIAHAIGVGLALCGIPSRWLVKGYRDG